MHLRRIDNPPNPFHSRHAEYLEEPPAARIEIYEESSGSILSRNDSPDLPFTWSVNPYRGCQHACAYCYARTYHEYLGLGAGTDFETKLIVKRDAPRLLRHALTRRSWQGESINFSGVTDCYQPIEAEYEITRECLQVCAELRNPAVIVTKSFLVVRDIDVLTELHERGATFIYLSIPFADEKTCKLIEPFAPPPARRFEAIRRLSDVGLRVGVFVAPIIPGLNDSDIPRILERAADAGASTASYTALRLSGNVEPVFVSRLREVMPLRVQRIVNRIRDMRGGKLDETRFGARMRGQGPYWESICDLFRISKERYGLTGNSDCPAAPRNRTANKPAEPQLTFEF